MRHQTFLCVGICDGTVCLAVVTASMYRRDLREAGIGNGEHGFVYPLGRHLRDHRSHHVTVQIVGANVTPRDSGTDGLPPPVTRRTQPPLIPHFSLPPLWRWAYFTVLRRALVLAPVPVWRLLAVILAGVQLVLDRQMRRLNVALLRAFGIRPSLATCWRTHCTRAYQRQADLILLALGNRVTPRWAAQQVRMPERLPRGTQSCFCASLRVQVSGSHARHAWLPPRWHYDPPRRPANHATGRCNLVCALASHGTHRETKLWGSAIRAQ